MRSTLARGVLVLLPLFYYPPAVRYFCRHSGHLCLALLASLGILIFALVEALPFAADKTK